MKKIITIFMMLTLISCENKMNKKEFNIEELTISYKDIFSQKEQNYQILYFLPSCLSCQNILKLIEARYNEQNYAIYLVNVTEDNFKKGDEKETNVGSSSYEDIYIYSTPTLLVITSKVVKYQIIGFEEIRKYYME